MSDDNYKYRSMDVDLGHKELRRAFMTFAKIRTRLADMMYAREYINHGVLRYTTEVAKSTDDTNMRMTVHMPAYMGTKGEFKYSYRKLPFYCFIGHNELQHSSVSSVDFEAVQGEELVALMKKTFTGLGDRIFIKGIDFTDYVEVTGPILVDDYGFKKSIKYKYKFKDDLSHPVFGNELRYDDDNIYYIETLNVMPANVADLQEQQGLDGFVLVSDIVRISEKISETNLDLFASVSVLSGSTNLDGILASDSLDSISAKVGEYNLDSNITIITAISNLDTGNNLISDVVTERNLDGFRSIRTPLHLTNVEDIPSISTYYASTSDETTYRTNPDYEYLGDFDLTLPKVTNEEFARDPKLAKRLKYEIIRVEEPVLHSEAKSLRDYNRSHHELEIIDDYIAVRTNRNSSFDYYHDTIDVTVRASAGGEFIPVEFTIRIDVRNPLGRPTYQRPVIINVPRGTVIESVVPMPQSIKENDLWEAYLKTMKISTAYINYNPDSNGNVTLTNTNNSIQFKANDEFNNYDAGTVFVRVKSYITSNGYTREYIVNYQFNVEGSSDSAFQLTNEVKHLIVTGREAHNLGKPKRPEKFNTIGSDDSDYTYELERVDSGFDVKVNPATGMITYTPNRTGNDVKAKDFEFRVKATNKRNPNRYYIQPYQIVDEEVPPFTRLPDISATINVSGTSYNYSGNPFNIPDGRAVSFSEEWQKRNAGSDFNDTEEPVQHRAPHPALTINFNRVGWRAGTFTFEGEYNYPDEGWLPGRAVITVNWQEVGRNVIVLNDKHTELRSRTNNTGNQTIDIDFPSGTSVNDYIVLINGNQSLNDSGNCGTIRYSSGMRYLIYTPPANDNNYNRETKSYRITLRRKDESLKETTATYTITIPEYRKKNNVERVVVTQIKTMNDALYGKVYTYAKHSGMNDILNGRDVNERFEVITTNESDDFSMGVVGVNTVKAKPLNFDPTKPTYMNETFKQTVVYRDKLGEYGDFVVENIIELRLGQDAFSRKFHWEVVDADSNTHKPIANANSKLTDDFSFRFNGALSINRPVVFAIRLYWVDDKNVRHYLVNDGSYYSLSVYAGGSSNTEYYRNIPDLKSNNVEYLNSAKSDIGKTSDNVTNSIVFRPFYDVVDQKPFYQSIDPVLKFEVNIEARGLASNTDRLSYIMANVNGDHTDSSEMRIDFYMLQPTIRATVSNVPSYTLDTDTLTETSIDLKTVAPERSYWNPNNFEHNDNINPAFSYHAVGFQGDNSNMVEVVDSSNGVIRVRVKEDAVISNDSRVQLAYTISCDSDVVTGKSYGEITLTLPKQKAKNKLRMPTGRSVIEVDLTGVVEGNEDIRIPLPEGYDGSNYGDLVLEKVDGPTSNNGVVRGSSYSTSLESSSGIYYYKFLPDNLGYSNNTNTELRGTTYTANLRYRLKNDDGVSHAPVKVIYKYPDKKQYNGIDPIRINMTDNDVHVYPVGELNLPSWNDDIRNYEFTSFIIKGFTTLEDWGVRFTQNASNKNEIVLDLIGFTLYDLTSPIYINTTIPFLMKRSSRMHDYRNWILIDVEVKLNPQTRQVATADTLVTEHNLGFMIPSLPMFKQHVGEDVKPVVYFDLYNDKTPKWDVSNIHGDDWYGNFDLPAGSTNNLHRPDAEIHDLPEDVITRGVCRLKMVETDNRVGLKSSAHALEKLICWTVGTGGTDNVAIRQRMPEIAKAYYIGMAGRVYQDTTEPPATGIRLQADDGRAEDSFKWYDNRDRDRIQFSNSHLGYASANYNAEYGLNNIGLARPMEDSWYERVLNYVPQFSTIAYLLVRSSPANPKGLFGKVLLKVINARPYRAIDTAWYLSTGASQEYLNWKASKQLNTTIPKGNPNDYPPLIGQVYQDWIGDNRMIVPVKGRQTSIQSVISEMFSGRNISNAVYALSHGYKRFVNAYEANRLDNPAVRPRTSRFVNSSMYSNYLTNTGWFPDVVFISSYFYPWPSDYRIRSDEWAQFQIPYMFGVSDNITRDINHPSIPVISDNFLVETPSNDTRDYITNITWSTTAWLHTHGDDFGVPEVSYDTMRAANQNSVVDGYGFRSVNTAANQIGALFAIGQKPKKLMSANILHDSPETVNTPWGSMDVRYFYNPRFRPSRIDKHWMPLPDDALVFGFDVYTERQSKRFSNY